MITPGSVAPVFSIPHQNGSLFQLRDYLGKNHVLLLFLPAAFTPICTTELPALAALRERFWTEANTVVAAVTTDQTASNREWARRCGAGQIFVLSDYYPQGAVSKAYGAWLPNEGIADRATVIVAKDGIVRYAESVGKFGKRSVPTLLSIARAIDGKAPLTQSSAKMPLDLPILFVTGHCPYCKSTLDLLRSLHLEDRVVVRNVDNDQAAMRLLLQVNSHGAVPTLYFGGKVYEGAPSIGVTLKNLAKRAA